jgi:hypothetical protein
MTCIVTHSIPTLQKDIDQVMPIALTGRVRIRHIQAKSHPINQAALAALSERTAGAEAMR